MNRPPIAPIPSAPTRKAACWTGRFISPLLLALLATRTATAGPLGDGVGSPGRPRVPLADEPSRVTTLPLPPLPPRRGPVVRGALASNVSTKLKMAFPVATRVVTGNPVCSDLFAGQRYDGLTLLLNSRYTAATTREESNEGPCSRGAAAMTGVGSAEVRLCLNFRNLVTSAAATILIHEALHYAGTREAPGDPTAPTPDQINARIRTSCGL